MKVDRTRSVGAKLFYMTSLLVLITITGNSWQFVKTFFSYQKEQIQNSIQIQSEISGGRIESEFDILKSQLATAIPSFKGGIEKKSIENQIKNFLSANSELVSLSIYQTSSESSLDFQLIGENFTPYLTNQRFEDKNPSFIRDILKKTSLKFLNRYHQILLDKTFFVDGIAKTTQLPLMMLATKFEVSGSESVIWAVLTAWQSSILKAIPGSSDTEIVLVDRKGKIVSSQSFSQLRNREIFSGIPLVKMALSAKTPSGFRDEYIVNGKRKLGAFFKISKYGLIVLVQKDAEKAYLVMKRNLMATTLWACLFILISLLFSYVVSRGITKTLRELVYATEKIASGDFNYRIIPSTKDEVAQLSFAVNKMSSRILELMSSQVEKARFEKELETAKMVQQTFFPKKQIERLNLTVHGYYTPASQCGGDLWGHFSIDEGVDFIFVADAMGHGAPAALVTAMAYSTTMTIADLIKDYNYHQNSPSKILERINRIIYDAVGGKISMTFFASIIDSRQRKIIFSNAGHNFPLLIPIRADDSRLSEKHKNKYEIKPITLKLMGSPLGIDPQASFRDLEMAISPGDKLVYFTDGLIECASPSGRNWGRKNLVSEISGGVDLSAEALCNKIIKEAFKFYGNAPIADDVTVVVAELSKDFNSKFRQDENSQEHSEQHQSDYDQVSVDFQPNPDRPDIPEASSYIPSFSEAPQKLNVGTDNHSDVKQRFRIRLPKLA